MKDGDLDRQQSYNVIIIGIMVSLYTVCSISRWIAGSFIEIHGHPIQDTRLRFDCVSTR